jgi:hypothetical protein
MGFNFNNYGNEYTLSNNLTSELIDLYGLTVSYIKTEKVGATKTLSEYQFLRANNESVYKINVYPENTAGYDNQTDLLSKFGMLMFDNINMYISRNTFEIVFPNEDFLRAVGDLIVMPSKQIFEIADVEAQVPGLNNMFLFDNQKNVYLLKLKPYNYNQDQINIVGDEGIPDFSSIFDNQAKIDEKSDQQTESKIVKNMDPVFGDLG